MKFNVCGYIHSIDTNKLILTVDEDDKEKIDRILTTLYKTKKDSNSLKIGLTKTNFEINNFDWTNPDDLIGLHVEIHVQSKYYCFKKTSSEVNHYNNKESFVIIKGYSFNAIHITNI
jgi:hypothetical protein